MRPTRDEMLMEMARVAARRSSCARAHVGVVIAREGRPLTMGYNGAPAGMTHCDHTCDCKYGNDLQTRTHETPCRSLRPCMISVHAEANAIAFAARWGVSLEGAELHTTLTPCIPCAQLIINTGIIRVVSMVPHHDPSRTGVQLLENAGIATA